MPFFFFFCLQDNVTPFLVILIKIRHFLDIVILKNKGTGKGRRSLVDNKDIVVMVCKDLRDHGPRGATIFSLSFLIEKTVMFGKFL